MLELIETVDLYDATPPREPICKDRDEDCEDIEDHLGCWLYDMRQGRCPYLTKD
jgi:hypothetical protein